MRTTELQPEPSREPEHPRNVLLANLAAIRAVVRAVHRRYGRAGEDECELLSDVFLRLVQDDYAVLRKFRGESSLRTYLHKVATRVLLDRRVGTWGKWRPSARALALGEAARQLERLVVRDHLGAQEAIGALTHTPGTKLGYDAAVRLYGALRPRPRARHTPLDREADRLAAWPDDDGVALREAGECAVRLAAALRLALDALEPDDYRLLRLRYCEGKSVADIARASGRCQKRLYRACERALGRLRSALAHSGVSIADVREVVGHARVGLDEVFERAEPAA